MKWSIIGAAYKGRSIGLDAQECVNLYPEASPSAEAKNAVSLIGTPGLKILATIGTQSAGCRGMYATARSRLLSIYGNTLYEILPDYTYVVRGTLNTYTGTVSFAEIDKQVDPTSAAVSHVMMVDGSNGYILNTLTNVFSIIGGDYLPGTSVTSQNGFFIQNLNDNNKFIYSNQYDGLTWEASLNYFGAESSPDPILWLTVVNNQLWLIGSSSIEIWNFTGDPDFLWQRAGIGYINTGMAGRYCATTLLGNNYWLGSDREGQNIFWKGGISYTPERISTHAIEYILTMLDRVDDCIALSYVQEGHQFVVFNFPTGNRTLVYDVATDLWHERGSFNNITGLNDRHRAVHIANWSNKILVGDHSNSCLYEWSLDQNTDDGKIIKRIRVAPHIHNERHRVFFHQAEIDLVRGQGLTGNADPHIMLDISNDGGYTYVPLQIMSTSGRIGARLTRCRWNKLGMSRDRVFRITMTDAVKWHLIDGRITADSDRSA